MDQIAVYTFAKWRVKEGRLETVLRTLAQVAKQTIDEEGNLFYRVHQSNSDINTLILFEGYADESAAKKHSTSSYFQNLVVGRIVPDLESREVIAASKLDLNYL